jgi:hypothetical protein
MYVFREESFVLQLGFFDWRLVLEHIVKFLSCVDHFSVDLSYSVSSLIQLKRT